MNISVLAFIYLSYILFLQHILVKGIDSKECSTKNIQ